MKPATPRIAESLPEIGCRQLEFFSVVCRERSYANAALELQTTRANVKRVCRDFEAVVGRSLFEETAERLLVPTPFAQELLLQVGPLSRSLRKLGEGVRGLHQAGRILRFAAAGEFFRGGLFTDFLARLKTADLFRSCFLRIEVKRFRTALLNAECDVYFGVGLGAADRLDAVDLGPVPWRILGQPDTGPPPACPADLAGGGWWIALAGEPDVAEAMLASFRAAGAKGGGVWEEGEQRLPAGLLFVPDLSGGASCGPPGPWPAYRLSACLRRNHPYAELPPRLAAAALAHGH
jgi:DNA-binding transcriptional LysR family regulator